MPRKYPGLFPSEFSVDEGQYSGSTYGLDAGSDSFYEYLLKLWLSCGDMKYRNMYDNFTVDAVEQLVVYSPDGLLVWTPNRGMRSEFHHLSCFSGGMFVLGEKTNPSGIKNKDLIRLGKGITDTCYKSYLASKSGLGSDIVSVNGNKLEPSYNEVIDTDIRNMPFDPKLWSQSSICGD